MKTPYQLLSFLIVIALFGCKTGNEPESPQTPSATEGAVVTISRISIHTENQATIASKDTYVNCSIDFDSDSLAWKLSTTAKIRGRGNSSWLWYPKKPYKIKLDKKASVFGLKEEKDWVLLADYRDPTHLMNTFVFTIGQEFGLAFTNHVRYAELTLNDSYMGLYILTEQVEQGENRVAIDEKEGILLSLDADDGPELSPTATDNFWSTVYQMPVCVKNPTITGTAQLSPIKTSFSQLESAIKNGDYDAVANLMDIQSFIDFMLIQELVYNVEVDAPRSMYLYKNTGGKWTFGPLWDFDAGFDFDWSTMYTGHNYFSSYTELVLGTDPVNHTKGYAVPSFFTDLFRSKRFVTAYKARWTEVKDRIMGKCWPATQQYADAISVVRAKDAARWPIGKDGATETLHLKQWLTNRISYLSTVISAYPSGSK